MTARLSKLWILFLNYL